MTSNVAAAQTPPAPSSQGFSSRAAVRGRVDGVIVHRLSVSTPQRAHCVHSYAVRLARRLALFQQSGT